MKTRITELESTADKHAGLLEKHETEISLLRKFKHETSGQIHTHNGKLNIIENQQVNTNTELSKIREILEDFAKKIGTIMTLKSMIIGGGIVFVPTVTGMFFLFQWYLQSKGL